jgi:hypothetical protein
MGIGIPRIGSHMSSKQVGIFQENLMGGNYNTFTMPRTPRGCLISPSFWGGPFQEDEKIGDGGTPAFCDFIKCVKEQFVESLNDRWRTLYVESILSEMYYMRLPTLWRSILIN